MGWCFWIAADAVRAVAGLRFSLPSDATTELAAVSAGVMLAFGGAVAGPPLLLGWRRFPRRRRALATLCGLAAAVTAALFVRDAASGLPAQGWAGFAWRLTGVLVAGWGAAAAGLYVSQLKAGNALTAVLCGVALYSWVKPQPEVVVRAGSPLGGGVFRETGGEGRDAGDDGGSRVVDAPAGSPDLILLTIDTWRADASGRGGAQLVDGLMPSLARDFAAAQWYDMAVAPVPLTGPSHAASLAGIQPWELGLMQNGHPVPAGHPWVPTHLRDRGYTTAAFVSSAMLDGDLGFARGFTTFDDDLDGRAAWRRTVWGALLPPRSMGSAHRSLWERTGEETLARLEAWLGEQRGEEPLFIWVHLYEPHSPYQPPDDAAVGWTLEPGRLPRPLAYIDHPSHGRPRKKLPHTLEMLRKRQRANPEAGPSPFDMLDETRDPPDKGWYDDNGPRIRERARSYLGEVRYADELAGDLVALLAAQRGDRPRAWVVTGDHGESLTEHHEYGSHQRHVYEANVRVPLLVLPADGGAAGPPVEQPVSTTCVAGTLAALAGIAGDRACALPGPWDSGGLARAADSAVRGPDHGDREGSTLKVAVREGRIKLVAGMAPATEDSPAQPGTVSWREWYDLDLDPHEVAPLPLESIDEEVRHRLEERAAALMRAAEQSRRGPAEVGAEVRQALEALGYVE